MKYFNTLIPVGEYFKVVIPKWDKPKRNKFSQSPREQQMWEEELQEQIKDWDEHISSLPQAALTKSNKQGWMENVIETYEVLEPVPPDGVLKWVNRGKAEYEKYKDCEDVTRIVIIEDDEMEEY